ncbi:DinB family protein [Ferruginibacter paludis]|uniref:DinB family protein n=1 Tax=Ferruginibacter paludis TaxID=1310417 RepID=UPI0025B5E243|nr:DinB family protein [Ferruginibacter paludis]MDN3657611.1 DinB family protein [Ferruginibacter paludis]
MSQNKKQAAIKAILGEYQKAVNALQELIMPLDSLTLTTIVDAGTTDADCRSIQTILAHVVHSGYGYAVYIRKHKNFPGNRPEKELRLTAVEYKSDLDKLLRFTDRTFGEITDDELEEMNNEKKLLTGWGQHYDIEQMMEHAIVHVLRHRRQIENFVEIIKVR